MRSEVFIPNPQPGGLDVTLALEARDWMSALNGVGAHHRRANGVAPYPGRSADGMIE